MKPRSWQSVAGWLIVLLGVGVGGWFLGAEVVANEAQRPPTVVVQSVDVAAPAAGQTGVGAGVILPIGGLSPFGHPDGLLGRQVLIGRVVSVDADSLIVDWAGGRTVLRFAEDSDLLLRLSADSSLPIEPGAAIALLVDEAGGEIVARSGLVLPEGSRPQNQDQRFPGTIFPDPEPESS